MIRIVRKPEAEATVHDCVAHRCDAHAGIDTVQQAHVSGDGENFAECAYCVAQATIRTLVEESLFPVAVAFEAAEGQLRLLGVDKNPRTAALFRLLEALTQKTGENDFQITAQKVIAGIPQAAGPERPQ